MIKFPKPGFLLAVLVLTLSTLACSLTGGSTGGEQTPTATATPSIAESAPDPTKTPTPTPTLLPQAVEPTEPAPEPGPCEGVAGELEMQILVGPAEAVGLEPHAVGAIPFAVTKDQVPYLVQGGGDITYADILAEEWGTYEVTLNTQTTINGECVEGPNGGELHLALEMTGSQMVEVTAEGFHGEYPWEGTIPFDLVFPLEEGASMEGEGWAFVLHLSK